MLEKAANWSSNNASPKGYMHLKIIEEFEKGVSRNIERKVNVNISEHVKLELD